MTKPTASELAELQKICRNETHEVYKSDKSRRPEFVSKAWDFDFATASANERRLAEVPTIDDYYIGWKIVGVYSDGSYHLQSPGGQLTRCTFYRSAKENEIPMDVQKGA